MKNKMEVHLQVICFYLPIAVWVYQWDTYFVLNKESWSLTRPIDMALPFGSSDFKCIYFSIWNMFEQ